MNPHPTTPSVLAAMAHDLPDHTALIGHDRSFTFAQLRETVRTAAAAMIALGVQAGDRVAIWAPNSWQWVVAALGAHHAGAVVVPISPALTATEAADFLGRTRARLLIAAESILGADRSAGLDRRALPALAHVVAIPASGDRDFLTGPRASAADVDARAAAMAPDDVSEILFTSGTTGRSKGALGTHRQSFRQAGDWADRAAMTPADRYLCMNPLAFTFGYRGGMIVCLARGAALVPVRSFDPGEAIRIIGEQRITVVPGPPTLFQALLDHPRRAADDLRSLRVAVVGGAAVSAALLERVRRELGFRDVINAYGLTEGTAAVTMSGCGDDPSIAARSSGRPIAGFEIRIDAPDDDGIGAVLLRGPNVTLGYLDDPAATAEAIDADGWLHTGDTGSLDSAGNLRITGRLTDMYICGGSNVYPAEVEQVLARLDGVAESAVIGVPDDVLGEVGRVFVVRRPGAELDDQDVLGHLRANLAAYKIPRSVIFLDRLPRNPSGKVLTSALREWDHTPRTAATPPGLGGPPVGAAENWVADAWQLILNIARPGRRDRFTEIGGDSLAALRFSQMMHTRFDVDLSIDALAGLPTIADVVAALAPGGGRQRQPVVRLRTGTTDPLCLLVPGIGGHAWTFAATADAVTAPCEIVALSLNDLGEGPPEQTRDRIRAAALTAVRPAVEQGRPVVVGGYSFGALIATDLAAWLGEQGVPVAELLLADPDPLDAGQLNWDPRTLHKRPGMFTLEPGSPAARRLAKEVDAVAGLLQTAYLDGSATLPGVPVAVLRTTMMVREHGLSPTVFGTPIAALDTTVVDLDHLDLIRIPHVTHLAGWIDRQLTAIG